MKIHLWELAIYKMLFDSSHEKTCPRAYHAHLFLFSPGQLHYSRFILGMDLEFCDYMYMYLDRNTQSFCKIFMSNLDVRSCQEREEGLGDISYTVDSCYLEIKGTLKNTSRYPYFDISDL